MKAIWQEHTCIFVYQKLVSHQTIEVSVDYKKSFQPGQLWSVRKYNVVRTGYANQQGT